MAGTVSEKVILLVEDNPMDEELTLRALKKSKVLNPVVVARDGVAALDYLFARGAHAGRSSDELPQLVLLDLKLPKLDGLEVLKEVRQNAMTKLLPVVILTSSIEEDDVARGYTLGANSYVRKPVDFDHFSEAVRQLGLYWLVLNQSVPPGRRA
ncbi:MAG TPA: response regulator [Polyangiaceae bacterium]|nr:response regulator [Polyangiaceae bacterium]